MSRTVYVNGDYLPEAEAKISIFDRGFLMADGVYEVTSVLDGKLIDFAGPLPPAGAVAWRELDMAAPVTDDELAGDPPRTGGAERHRPRGWSICRSRAATRATATSPFPTRRRRPRRWCCSPRSKPGLADSPAAKTGIKVISIPDIRWGRRDIKTVQLLYPSMGKMMAKKAGCDDAWMVEDGFVTEGTSNNAYIVKGNRIITRQLSNDILHGITRAAVLRFAAEAQMEVEERPFTIAEAQGGGRGVLHLRLGLRHAGGRDRRRARSAQARPARSPRGLREIYLDEMRKAAI